MLVSLHIARLWRVKAALYHVVNTKKNTKNSTRNYLRSQEKESLTRGKFPYFAVRDRFVIKIKNICPVWKSNSVPPSTLEGQTTQDWNYVFTSSLTLRWKKKTRLKTKYPSYRMHDLLLKSNCFKYDVPFFDQLTKIWMIEYIFPILFEWSLIQVTALVLVVNEFIADFNRKSFSSCLYVYFDRMSLDIAANC